MLASKRASSHRVCKKSSIQLYSISIIQHYCDITFKMLTSLLIGIAKEVGGSEAESSQGKEAEMGNPLSGGIHEAVYKSDGVQKHSEGRKNMYSADQFGGRNEGVEGEDRTSSAIKMPIRGK